MLAPQNIMNRADSFSDQCKIQKFYLSFSLFFVTTQGSGSCLPSSAHHQEPPLAQQPLAPWGLASDVACSGVMPNGQPHDGRPHTAPIAPSPLATASFRTTLDRIRTTLSRTSHSETLLRDEAWPTILRRMHSALDTGKPITGAGPNRGLPMDVVVQTLKASWHVDGTWPVGPNAMRVLEEQSRDRAKADKGPEGKQDPSPYDVAQAYRDRGVLVEEPQKAADDEW